MNDPEANPIALPPIDAAPLPAPPNSNRDERGRFVPGHALPGPGAPRRPNFAMLVDEHVKAKGSTVELAVAEVYEALLASAKAGDTAAAKLLLDRLTEREPAGSEVSVNVTTNVHAAPVGPPPVPGDFAAYMRAFMEASKELDEALAANPPSVVQAKATPQN